MPFTSRRLRSSIKASLRIRHMTADMRELVQQAEPEIIQPVVTQSQPDNRGSVRKLERRAIEMRARQMLKADQMDSMLGEKFLGQPRAVFRPA